MMCIRCGCASTAERRDKICDECRKNMEDVMAKREAEDEKTRKWVQSMIDELQRFREREPLVQALIEAGECFGYDQPITYTSVDAYNSAKAVRDFGPCIAGASAASASAAEMTRAEATESAESLGSDPLDTSKTFSSS